MKLVSFRGGLAAARSAVQRRFSRVSSARSIGTVLATATLLAAQHAQAALPGVVTPPGVAGGDFIALLQQYWKLGVAVLVLMVGTYAFVEVSGGAIAKFHEWRMGKAELADLKWFFFIGVIMLVAVVYLLTTAAGIL